MNIEIEDDFILGVFLCIVNSFSFLSTNLSYVSNALVQVMHINIAFYCTVACRFAKLSSRF